MDDFGFGGGAMTPQQLQAFMEYAAGQGAFSEQDRAIQQQMQQAHELRKLRGAPHSTGLGAALGGIGDMINAWTAATKQNRASEDDKLLQQQHIASLRRLASAYNPKPLPGYDAESGTLMDPSGAAYMMPGPIR